MPNSNVHQCADCLESYCETCDFNSGSCPDCSSRLCEDCMVDAQTDERQGRCYTCHDPWTSHVQYLGENKTLIKRHLQSRRGTLRE